MQIAEAVHYPPQVPPRLDIVPREDFVCSERCRCIRLETHYTVPSFAEDWVITNPAPSSDIVHSVTLSSLACVSSVLKHGTDWTDTRSLLTNFPMAGLSALLFS